MRRLGDSVDWSRDRFTMDPGLSRAVVEVFVRLHEEGLIYRGKRLVNWDPVLLTALSDLEVRERGGRRLALAPALSARATAAATSSSRPRARRRCSATRPSRCTPRTSATGTSSARQLRLPLADRPIPIIADEYVDPEFGSGVVKITPAHDFNDYEIGLRHELPQINIFTPRAALNDNVPERFRGLDRFEARKRVVAELEAAGLLERIEKHQLKVPRGDRSGAVLEPYLTDQWYVKIAPLAAPAIEAVERRPHPLRSGELGEDLLRVDAQHQGLVRQPPALVGPPDPGVVRRPAARLRRAAAKRRFARGTASPQSVTLRQDNDVLDTWFSSALWPFSTLGWPDTHAGAGRLLPDERAGHRLRHHLLLGRADDDDGPEVHGRRAVPRRLHHRADPR